MRDQPRGPRHGERPHGSERLTAITPPHTWYTIAWASSYPHSGLQVPALPSVSSLHVTQPTLPCFIVSPIDTHGFSEGWKDNLRRPSTRLFADRIGAKLLSRLCESRTLMLSWLERLGSFLIFLTRTLNSKCWVQTKGAERSDSARKSVVLWRSNSSLGGSRSDQAPSGHCWNPE